MKTKNLLPKILISILALCIAYSTPIYCNGVSVANNVHYVSDLENKQECLNDIREDTVAIEKGLLRKLETKDGHRLDALKEGLVNMVPPSSKISIQPPQMAGTLTPPAIDIEKKDLEKTKK